jgi:hypothetical protein
MMNGMDDTLGNAQKAEKTAERHNEPLHNLHTPTRLGKPEIAHLW